MEGVTGGTPDMEDETVAGSVPSPEQTHTTGRRAAPPRREWP